MFLVECTGIIAPDARDVIVIGTVGSVIPHLERTVGGRAIGGEIVTFNDGGVAVHGTEGDSIFERQIAIDPLLLHHRQLAVVDDPFVDQPLPIFRTAIPTQPYILAIVGLVRNRHVEGDVLPLVGETHAIIDTVIPTQRPEQRLLSWQRFIGEGMHVTTTIKPGQNRSTI